MKKILQLFCFAICSLSKTVYTMAFLLYGGILLAEFLQVLHQIFSPQGVQYLVMGYDIVVDCLDGLELFIYQGNWFLQGVCNLVD